MPSLALTSAPQFISNGLRSTNETINYKCVERFVRIYKAVATIDSAHWHSLIHRQIYYTACMVIYHRDGRFIDHAIHSLSLCVCHSGISTKNLPWIILNVFRLILIGFISLWMAECSGCARSAINLVHFLCNFKSLTHRTLCRHQHNHHVFDSYWVFKFCFMVG